jgi:hypothetical protein
LPRTSLASIIPSRMPGPSGSTITTPTSSTPTSGGYPRLDSPFVMRSDSNASNKENMGRHGGAGGSGIARPVSRDSSAGSGHGAGSGSGSGGAGMIPKRRTRPSDIKW